MGDSKKNPKNLPEGATVVTVDAGENKAPLPPCSFRPMTEDDLSYILGIEQLSYPQPWSDLHFQNELSKPYSVQWVLTDDETDSQIFAYVVFWKMEKDLEILNFTVHPEWRQRGIGERMLQQVAKEGVRIGAERLILDVRKSNLAAVQLYQKAGFSIQQIRKGFYANGDDAYHMTLALEGPKVEF